MYNTNDSDILMSYDTDIAFEYGDLMYTTGADYIKRVVFKLLISELNDWKLTPNIGANPTKYIGEHNSRDTAAKLQNYILERIAPEIQPITIDVRVIPIDYDSVKCYIDLYAYGMSIGTVPFTMDFINGFTYTQFDNRVDKIISSKRHKINAPNEISRPNLIKDIISKQ